MTTALDAAREKIVTSLLADRAGRPGRLFFHDVVARAETIAAPLGSIFTSASKFRVTCDNSSHPLTENIKR